MFYVFILTLPHKSKMIFFISYVQSRIYEHLLYFGLWPKFQRKTLSQVHAGLSRKSLYCDIQMLFYRDAASVYFKILFETDSYLHLYFISTPQEITGRHHQRPSGSKSLVITRRYLRSLSLLFYFWRVFHTSINWWSFTGV